MAINVTKPSVNLREKLNELETNKGLKGNEILQAETAQEVRSLIGAGRKNLIINGGFDVWQRGTSHTTHGYGSADRHYVNLSGGVGTFSQQTFAVAQTDVPFNPTYYANFNVTTGNDNCGWHYRLENRHLIGNTPSTFSFYAKSNAPRLMEVKFTASDGTSNANAGAQTFTPTASWVKYSFTATLDTTALTASSATNYTRMMIDQGVDTSTAAWQIDIANVQLELGSVATDFEHRSFGEELALCKRYYQKSFVYSTTPANGANSSGFSTQAGLVYSQASHNSSNRDYYHFEVEMRTTPSLTMYGNSSGYWHSPTSNWHVHNKVTNEVSSKGFGFRQQASGGVIPVRGHYAASAEL